MGYFTFSNKSELLKNCKFAEVIMFLCRPFKVLGSTTTKEGINLTRISALDTIINIYLPSDSKVDIAEFIDFENDDLPF